MESRYRDVAIGLSGAGLSAAFSRALFPHDCASCGDEGDILCRACHEEIRGPRKGLFACPTCGTATPFGASCAARKCLASPLDGLMSIAPYGDRTLRRLLRAWKYDRVDDAGRILTSIFGDFVLRHRATFEAVAGEAMIVPVPLAFLRRASRGFNQSELLATTLANAIDAPVLPGLLRRSHGRPAQAAMSDRVARAENVTDVFRASRSAALGGRYLLVDDVATSSATLRECARALKAAGAGSVWGITLLRG